jgi:hypothetical protein
VRYNYNWTIIWEPSTLCLIVAAHCRKNFIGIYKLTSKAMSKRNGSTLESAVTSYKEAHHHLFKENETDKNGTQHKFSVSTAKRILCPSQYSNSIADAGRHNCTSEEDLIYARAHQTRKVSSGGMHIV